MANVCFEVLIEDTFGIFVALKDSLKTLLENVCLEVFIGDTFGQFMTEINVTSPTGIQEINRLMGTNLESELTDAVERKLTALR